MDRARITSLMIGIVFLLFPALLWAATMENYCILPPYIVSGARPNLLLMIDNSASMYDTAYVTSGTYCYDNTFSPAGNYAGYFDETQLYSYSGDRFSAGVALPESCTYRTAYLCVNMVGSDATRTVNQFIASGKFLNWLATSKFDIQKKVLTGGKYDVATQVLVGESRGCVGRRFVKEVPGLTGITFAVRGPNAVDPGYVWTATDGGQARIEVYEGNYNEADCIAAVTNWISGNYGQASTNTKGCLGISGGAGTSSGRILAAFNHSLQTCWLLKDNFKRGRDLWQGVNTQDLETSCTLIYENDGVDPSSIVDEKGGAYICSSVAPHVEVVPPFDMLGNDTSGFMGRCWKGSSERFTGNDTCVKREILHYCNGVDVAEVIDPSESASDTSGTWNIPAIVIDAGVRGLGDPIGPAGSAEKSFLVRVSSTPPGGVIKDFSGRIRFGAMSFNSVGSASECGLAGSNMKCPSVSNLDGSKVIHHIGYVADNLDESVGDHASGLINEIDSLKAETWTPFAEGFYNAIGYFARTDPHTFPPTAGVSDIGRRINAGDFDQNKNPSQYPCQRNNILIVTDGMSTGDLSASVASLVSSYNDGDGQKDSAVSTCPRYAGSRNLDDLAWLAWNRDITDFTKAITADDRNNPRNHFRYIKTYVIYSGSSSTEPGECNPETLMQQTALNGCGNKPECYQRPANYQELVDALKRVLQDLATPASGTASSVLASSQGSGANILQAIFYPTDKRFDQETTWTGEMQNLWYFLDPELQLESTKEDTNEDGILTLSSDYNIRFFFDPDKNRTRVKKCSDPTCTTPVATVELEDIKDIWRAGEKLWEKSPANRTIFTNDGTGRISFTTANAATLRLLLQAGSDAEASAIISYVRGEDVKYCSVTSSTSCTTHSDCPAGEKCMNRNRTVTIGGASNTWKLGDIISSTPKQQSSIPLNSYHLDPPSGYGDSTYSDFIDSANYKSRGVIYVGSNDGMLHAFRFGTLVQFHDADRKAQISGSNLGSEEWAFIPKNALPYLKYLSDPSYCHLYFLDSPPYLFDASIGGAPDGTKTQNSWRTIVIGAMGLGGACRNSGATCTDCVKAPIDGIGYSSYFALDVTDPLNPSLLWEFSREDLGFSTSGPAIVRRGEPGKNGDWYVVFGSGPTGPIDTSYFQFQGRSDQDLKLFVVNLRTGNLETNLQPGIRNAFSGSLINATIDTDRWKAGSGGFYQDDALYVGYTKKTGTEWTDGGILRVLTKEREPSAWEASILTDGIGPVTAAISKLQDRKNRNLWLYFGTGRYFFRTENITDDHSSQRKLFGIKEPCYTASSNSMNANCSSSLALSDLSNRTTPDDSVPNKGWYIDLSSCMNDSLVTENCSSASAIYKAERLITDPLATFNGAVFFVTVAPSSNVCGFGGRTYLWAVRYDTGAVPPSSALQGSALIQVSTGSIEQIKLSSAFTDRGGRRTSGGVFGVPPKGQGLTVIVNPRPIRRIMHIQER